MRRVAAVSVAAVALALLATRPARAQAGEAGAAPAAETARLDSVVRSFLPARFAGAVRVERGGRVLLDRGYGLANRERGVPNTPTTRFAIGSLTKQFTAAAIMLLAGDGRLRTSDPVTRWFPETSPAWDGMTLRHVLSHTAGIPNVQGPDELGDSAGTPGERAVRRFGRQRPEFAPGTSYAYSNTGYLVLGRVIELAGGLPYSEFVSRRILAPLGLADTGFRTAGTDSTRCARGYLARRGTVGAPPLLDLPRLDAAGALWSTTGDLLRWQRALLGGALLPPAALAEMTTAVQGDYAYGIHHRTGSGREAYYHTGRANGFESVLGYYPADSLAVVVLENLDTGAAADVFNQLVLAALRPAPEPAKPAR